MFGQQAHCWMCRVYTCMCTPPVAYMNTKLKACMYPGAVAARFHSHVKRTHLNKISFGRSRWSQDKFDQCHTPHKFQCTSKDVVLQVLHVLGRQVGCWDPNEGRVDKLEYNTFLNIAKCRIDNRVSNSWMSCDSWRWLVRLGQGWVTGPPWKTGEEQPRGTICPTTASTPWVALSTMET